VSALSREIKMTRKGLCAWRDRFQAGGPDALRGAGRARPMLPVRLRVACGFYQVSHSAAVAVVDPDARLVARLNPPLDPAQTAQFLADLFRRQAAQGATEAGR
jgi:cytochrome oxidase Cu insertion factor (SCO1/SenC/PrrC family)